MVKAPPEAPESPPGTLSALTARGTHRREAAANRKRRRRRALAAAPLVVLLSWAIVSYAIWMLQPTSMAWNIRSVGWVRADVPFGNWIVDHIEQIYYTSNAPK